MTVCEFCQYYKNGECQLGLNIPKTINHHAHPTSARHGLKWYEIDFNWWGIRTLQLLGLARSIKRVCFVAPARSWQLITIDGRRTRFERL